MSRLPWKSLYRAGADYVALLPQIGGQTVGRIVLADTVTVLINLPDGEMVVLKHARTPVNYSIKDITAKSGVRFLGIETGRGYSISARHRRTS